MPELLLSCQDLTKAFGAAPLFEGLSFGIFEGDHIGLVGPNGSGKSTLLKILAGLEPPSAGTRSARKRLRLGYVPQDPSFAPGATVASVLTEAAHGLGLEEHESEARVSVAMGRAGFADGAHAAATLSGGWKKRLIIARELARDPELLLLDEPTNHLDLDGILWLEELLQREPEAFLAVSHDRYFLEAAVGRVLELNRAFSFGLLDVKGRYSLFLEKKDQQLAGQAAYQDSLRNRVRGELEWLSRKAKARTRKSQARIGEARRMQDELADLDTRSRTEAVGIDFAGTERKTKRLLRAEGLTRSFGGRTLVRGLDLLLSPGQRLGLLGANGSGKTTLLRLLAGSDEPDAGSIERAPGLRVVMFDQHRSRLEPAVSLRRTLAPSGDAVVSQGREIHVAGWAKRFLFNPGQLDTPVGRLSGGEQARVLIAKLMLEPADLLLLDEPTNDLDIPTLEVLEESLLEFPGALVLVTHDRYLLDRVSTQLLALDGQGSARVYADYAQWELERNALERGPRITRSISPGSESTRTVPWISESEAPAPRGSESAATKPGGAVPGASESAASTTRVSAPASCNPAQGGKPRRLGYLEQREWEQMESRILEAEQRLATCETAAADPDVASDHTALCERLEALTAAQAAVDHLYARWAELEAKVKP